MDRQSLMDEAIGIFGKRFSHDPDLAVAAPGRANLIGEHTDYNDGHVLPIAIDRYLVAAAVNRPDRMFKLHTANLGESFEFDADCVPDERPQWASYLVGVVAEFERDGLELSGKEIAVYGDVPIGSGLSSSAALEVAAATAIERLEGLDIGDARIVNICRRADHNFVGIKSGPMDQFASRACRAGHAGLLDCRALEMSHHRLPGGVDFLSVYSGIPRSLAASEYNERQDSCRRAVEVLKEANPEIEALRDATPELVESQKGELGEPVYRRAKHVVTEQRRVFELIDAFEGNDLRRAGEILLDGHASLRDYYEVSLPVLDAMVDWLCRKPGVVGARLTGAGFGGSLICLVEAETYDLADLSRRFREEFENQAPQFPELRRLTSVDGTQYQQSIHE